MSATARRTVVVPAPGLVVRSSPVTALLGGPIESAAAGRLIAEARDLDAEPEALGRWVRAVLDAGGTAATVFHEHRDVVAFSGAVVVETDRAERSPAPAVAIRHLDAGASVSATLEAALDGGGIETGVVPASGFRTDGAEPSSPGRDRRIDLDAAQPPPTPLPVTPNRVDEDPAVPRVRGVRCRNGHLNHPDVRLCPRCGDNMQNLSMVLSDDGQLGEWGPRPPLGILVFDDGSTYQLDRDVVIGRAPQAGDPSTQTIAFPDDPRLSREHAMIELDGWEVGIRDLESSNGTHLRTAGEAAYRRIEPNVWVPLESGTVVLVGDRWATYTATSAVPRGTGAAGG